MTVLDYHGRELEIWAEAADAAKLRETASAIQDTWKRLRPRVVSRGGNAEAAAFDRERYSLSRVASSRTAMIAWHG